MVKKLDRVKTLTKWVKALRSDKYRQTQTTLVDDQGYCCLGVLCDVVDPNGWSYGEFTYKGQSDLSALPESLRKELGLKERTMSNLIRMNDIHDMTFHEIASYIERRLLRKKVK